MKTTRQRILDYIASRGVVTSAEVSAALRMTGANARHHLSTLVVEGVLQIVGERSTEQRGRPAQLYRLTATVSAHALDVLAAALLQHELERIDPARPEEMDLVLNQLAQRMAEALVGANRTAIGRSLAARLQFVVRRLAAFHYQPRWEAHARGPRLVLGHCPYGSLAPAHPQICQIDQRLLSLLVEADARQTAVLEETSPGLYQCVFEIHPARKISNP